MSRNAPGGERPEVTRAVVRAQPRQREARIGSRKVYLEHQEPFVVAEVDVELPGVPLTSLLSTSNASGSLFTVMDAEIVNRIGERAEFQIPAHAGAIGWK